ncbi:NUDIX domain-containing protein [Conexibacter sp. SYSU D00693]|uniref:NUDIX domain-containing protein n=1 Tax=Conexibacter sp. SYSU D00693 TaxID=2812560 RepID=UPI00196A9738|nr:NUDIX domain-containing protein [Conexibacter sp. SYSU D00693]
MPTVQRSAGLLLHRRAADGTREVLLGHMGGPFWARKDDGAWSIPKGGGEPGEDDEATARREFQEELGLPVPDGELVALGEVRQSSGKRVTAFALEADLDVSTITPGTFEMEWPPRSGRLQAFPEMDRAAWMDLDVARRRIVKGQAPLLDRLLEQTAATPGAGG